MLTTLTCQRCRNRRVEWHALLWLSGNPDEYSRNIHIPGSFRPLSPIAFQYELNQIPQSIERTDCFSSEQAKTFCMFFFYTHAKPRIARTNRFRSKRTDRTFHLFVHAAVVKSRTTENRLDDSSKLLFSSEQPRACVLSNQITYNSPNLILQPNHTQPRSTRFDGSSPFQPHPSNPGTIESNERSSRFRFKRTDRTSRTRSTRRTSGWGWRPNTSGSW